VVFLKWRDRIEEMQAMLDKHATDIDLARHFESDAREIYIVIRRYKLTRHSLTLTDEPKAPVPIVKTYREGKHTVKVGPDMWAEGARSGNPFVVRTRR
jgi:hypothetical protein